MGMQTRKEDWPHRGIGVEIDFEVLQVTGGGGGGVPFRRGLFLLAAAAVHCVAGLLGL